MFESFMRHCPKCRIDKPEDEFYWKVKGKTRHRCCKVCQRAYNKQHYNQNKKYYSDKARRREVDVLAVNRQHIWMYLSNHPCIDCGEDDPVVLQFDHRSDKRFNISTAMRYVDIEKLKEEIVKCEIRCANCHQRRHAKERNFWKIDKS